MNFKTNIAFRKELLQKLLENILNHEADIVNALFKDLKKPKFEAVLTETNYVVSDLKNTIKNLNSWAKPKRVLPSILNFPSVDYIFKQPYGRILIISPWNYPFQLAFSPLIAAVAAGNSVVLKPSEHAPNTASLIAKIVRETFDPQHVIAILGDATLAQDLLKKRWDYIFFTGSVAVGKIVAKAAAENLTPVTLELGGKNPCIIDDTANLKLTAKRIVWGKFMNAGQTCIAPDYIIVNQKIKIQLIGHLIIAIKNAFGDNPEKSPDFARIINTQHWQRLHNLIDPNKILHGGQTNQDDKYIAPTLIFENNLDSLLMQDEIFGPILPILTYETESDIAKIINKFEKPLALFVFSTNKIFAKKMTTQFSFGGGCINDTVLHFSNKRLPFGGVGHSGIGAYHGRFGFDSFSHQKAILKKPNWIDPPMRYAPYKNKIKYLQKIINWL